MSSNSFLGIVSFIFTVESKIWYRLFYLQNRNRSRPRGADLWFPGGRGGGRGMDGQLGVFGCRVIFGMDGQVIFIQHGELYVIGSLCCTTD